jgi:plastocyanin
VTQPETPAAAPLTRRERREAARTQVGGAQGATHRASPMRVVAFVTVAALVIGIGGYMAASVFLGQRGAAASTGVIPMRISMAGYDPRVLDAKPGETLTIDWWNTDGAMHLEGGVHSLVSDQLGIRLELPAESRKTITLTAPMAPGDYDFWCDTCCGGKGSPTMHATLRVEA